MKIIQNHGRIITLSIQSWGGSALTILKKYFALSSSTIMSLVMEMEKDKILKMELWRL